MTLLTLGAEVRILPPQQIKTIRGLRLEARPCNTTKQSDSVERITSGQDGNGSPSTNSIRIAVIMPPCQGGDDGSIPLYCSKYNLKSYETIESIHQRK